jgi:hypothetical protein
MAGQASLRLIANEPLLVGKQARLHPTIVQGHIKRAIAAKLETEGPNEGQT